VVVLVVHATVVAAALVHYFIQPHSKLQIHVQSQLVLVVLVTTPAQMQQRMEQFLITMDVRHHLVL
jgi:NADH/NAD ratio-sensing transcriptional regulator Rex